MINNLDNCSEEVKRRVNDILNSDAVHWFAKDIIRKGLKRDSLDASYDTRLALYALDCIFENKVLEG